MLFWPAFATGVTTAAIGFGLCVLSPRRFRIPITIVYAGIGLALLTLNHPDEQQRAWSLLGFVLAAIVLFCVAIRIVVENDDWTGPSDARRQWDQCECGAYYDTPALEHNRNCRRRVEFFGGEMEWDRGRTHERDGCVYAWDPESGTWQAVFEE